VVTNALGLDSEAIDRILDLPLDRLTVSIDSLDESPGQMLHGGSFAAVSDSLRILFRRKLLRRAEAPDVDIEFVATRRNIHELPRLRRQALVLGFSKILVSNVIPHTAELADDVLYDFCNTVSRGQKRSPWNPAVDMPVMDPCDEVSSAVQRLGRTGIVLQANGVDVSGAGSRCRFITDGRWAVCSDGQVSPCLALMHSHSYYFRGRNRKVRAYHLGNVNDTPLREIWESPDYRAFRARVRRFDFSPCVDCGGCDMRATNEQDCFGSGFPSCGECLWAAGLVQCP